MKNGEEVSVFTKYPNLVCFGGEHAAITAVAIVFLFMYLLSTTGILARLLFSASSVNTTFLTTPFVAQCHYWEIVILARRFSVAVVAVTTQGHTRNWMLAMIVFISLVHLF